MPDPYINIEELKGTLAKFFVEEKEDLGSFGSTVNQTFEAFVFASTIAWYRKKGWHVRLNHPKDSKGRSRNVCHLKFSTNGQPSNYSYAIASKDGLKVQIRHQLRVATAYHDDENPHPANICLDVAVIEDTDLSNYSSKCFVRNDKLATFGEAKHMSAFAELVASFLGLVHELQPGRLKRKSRGKSDHLAPFLYVSGWLNSTAQGLKETIEKRELDLDVYSVDNKLVDDVKITVTPNRRSSQSGTQRGAKIEQRRRGDQSKVDRIEELPY